MYTQKQQLAIDKQYGNILVSASARKWKNFCAGCSYYKQSNKIWS